MPSRTVSLPTYRRLTLLTTAAGALLFALGLIVIIQLKRGALGGPLIVAGILLGLSTAFLRVEGQAPARSRGSLLLYVRKECALCDEARAVLRPIAAELGLDVWEVDVDTDPELTAWYGDAVPVAVWKGREVFRTRVEAGGIRETLRTGQSRG